MKAGLIISIIVHLLILAILLVSFSASMPVENQQTEEVPITLVPLSDEMSLKQGEKQAEQQAKPSPRPTQKPETKLDAENAGDANIDTKMPLKPKEKLREVKAPPPPKGEQEGKNKPVIEKQLAEPSEPVEKQPEQAQEKSVPPKQAEGKPVPKPVAEPAVKPAEAETPAEAPKDDIGDFLKSDTADSVKAAKQEQPKPAEKLEPSVPELPQKAPLPARRPEEETKKQKTMAELEKQEKPQEKPAPAKGEKDSASAADSQNALIDRTRTQGGGAKRSQNEAGQGAQKTFGHQDNLQQTLNNIIGSCVARNWDIGVLQGGSAYDLRVQMHFMLNPDGSLVDEPDLTPAGGDLKDREVIVVQARAALKKCAPFKLPADKYAKWRDVTVNMKAFPD